MKKWPILILLIVGVFTVQAQIKKIPEPAFDFHQEYSFGNDELELGVPKTQGPKLVSEDNRFKNQEIVSLPMNESNSMPILHPEMQGYHMPVSTPMTDIDYTLLITPKPAEQDNQEQK